MSLDTAFKFRDQVNASPELQALLSKCWKVEQTIELAEEHGYKFNADEAVAVVNAAKAKGELSAFEQELVAVETGLESDELSDADLEMVAGGQPICCYNCGSGGPA